MRALPPYLAHPLGKDIADSGHEESDSLPLAYEMNHRAHAHSVSCMFSFYLENDFESALRRVSSAALDRT
jgi:hypothetical protein